ncbi:isochorismatase family protein [Rhodococcus sp. IEGM 1379]|uniref:isochorismatase family protein n=1 Tax=Rhodococcus sp. IEGM 1379 TaxID=3047086 RepID=UPI0024B65209|nr:isochorismatase family protein [Rhodococcus sp. IEGM 1379]MDI9915334.1 isochorismatase family protein [Rhodococcus sp. IEGM 1379]
MTEHMNAVSGDDLAPDYTFSGFGGSLPLGSRPALVIVDPAKAYNEPTSPLYAGAEKTVSNMLTLRAAASAAGIPVYLTQVLYDDEAGVLGGLFFTKVPALRYFVAGNPLAEFIDGFEPHPGEMVITKHYPSAFHGTSLAAALTATKVDTVLIAGFSTSGCIRATTIDSLQHGFVPVVVSDAVGDRHREPHESNLRDIAAKCGEVRSLDQALAFIRTLDA